MTLKKRLDRLEGATAKLAGQPCAVNREIVQPSATGPELLALMLRPPHAGNAVRTDRATGESDAVLRARFATMCSDNQRAKGVLLGGCENPKTRFFLFIKQRISRFMWCPGEDSNLHGLAATGT